jgi:FkbM family methyltransferase
MPALSTPLWIAAHPLSRGRRLLNLARFVSWQIGSRLSREPSVFELANGAKMFAKTGMTGATGNLYVGLHEFAEMAFLLHFLRPDDLFVDVGANVGSYSVLAGAAAGSDVIAFEPGEAFPWLVRNFELNGLRTARARHVAVGSTSGRVAFTVGADTMNRIDPAGAATVPLTTLNAACPERAPTLIKIDVEGFEADVLEGAGSLLERPEMQAIIMELNGPDARRLLEGRGFTCCGYDPFNRSMTEIDPAAANGIFVKDPIATGHRVASAPPFAVRGWVI